MASVIVFPESHRARNARHQFQQQKIGESRRKTKCRFRRLFFRQWVFRLWRVWNRPSGSREPQGNYMSVHPAVFSPSGVLAAACSPRLPFFEFEFLCTCSSVFPFFFNWRHKLKFEKPWLGCCTFSVHQFIRSTTNSHVIIVYIILSIPSTSQITWSCVIG